MANHTRTTVGTVTRGATLGSLFQWTPDSFTTLPANTPTEIANVEVADALALSLFLENEAGASGDVHSFEIQVSDDNVNWTAIFNRTLKNPITQGIKRLVCEVAGWKFRYVRILATSDNGNASAKAFLTGAIFSSAQTIVVSDNYDVFQKSFSRDVVWEDLIVSADPPTGAAGADVSKEDFVFFQVSVPTGTADFQIWIRNDVGDWSKLHRGDFLAISGSVSDRMKVSGIERVYIQDLAGTFTAKIGRIV